MPIDKENKFREGNHIPKNGGVDRFDLSITICGLEYSSVPIKYWSDKTINE